MVRLENEIDQTAPGRQADQYLIGQHQQKGRQRPAESAGTHSGVPTPEWRRDPYHQHGRDERCFAYLDQVSRLRQTVRDQVMNECGDRDRRDQRPDDEVDQDQPDDDRTTEAEVLRRAGVAKKNERCLGPPLRPASPLVEPCDQARLRALLRRRRQVLNSIAESGQTKAEVGIFRDVVGIPTSDTTEHVAPEMVRRTPEGDRKAEPHRADVEQIEQSRIFNGKQAREESVASVADRQSRLQTSEVARSSREPPRGLAQLPRTRPILGVIDGHDLAPRRHEPRIERTRLCPRLPVGHDEDAHVRRQSGGDQGQPGRHVVGLRQKKDVELGARIVDGIECGDEPGHHRGFTVERHENGIGWRLHIVDLAWHRGRPEQTHG